MNLLEWHFYYTVGSALAHHGVKKVCFVTARAMSGEEPAKDCPQVRRKETAAEKRKGAVTRPFPSVWKSNSCQAFSRVSG